jgi:gluconolactonase
MRFLPVLLALASALTSYAQTFTDIHIERIGANYSFTEGPLWTREGVMLFSDVPTDRIMKFTPGEGNSVFREKSNGANGNAMDDKGRIYTCESRTRRVVRTDKKGLEVVAEKWEGKRLNAPNDIVISRNGHVYFTDPAFGTQADTRELDFYGVYHITPKGELNLVAKPAGRPNGIALSPNGKVLYVVNSDERNVRAYDLDKNGVPGNERIFIKDIAGIPDGLKTDEKGNLYIAARHLEIYGGDGKFLKEIEIPEKPSNVAFGDADLQGLYVTARTSVYRIRLDVKGSVQHQQQ